MPAPGHYTVYWRNPKTRSFEKVPSVFLVGRRDGPGNLVVRGSFDPTSFESQLNWFHRTTNTLGDDTWDKGMLS